MKISVCGRELLRWKIWIWNSKKCSRKCSRKCSSKCGNDARIVISLWIFRSSPGCNNHLKKRFWSFRQQLGLTRRAKQCRRTGHTKGAVCMGRRPPTRSTSVFLLGKANPLSGVWSLQCFAYPFIPLHNQHTFARAQRQPQHDHHWGTSAHTINMGLRQCNYFRFYLIPKFSNHIEIPSWNSLIWIPENSCRMEMWCAESLKGAQTDQKTVRHSGPPDYFG